MSLVKTSPQIFTDGRLEEIVRRILKVGNPQKIVLFGSRARREARPDSDYDILIIEPSNLPRYKRAVVYRRALIGLGMAKDIIDIQKSFFQRFGAGIRRLGDFFFIFHPQIP
jgi:predicted nucleotidyltransferase